MNDWNKPTTDLNSTKTWTVEEIRAMLQSDDPELRKKAVLRGVVSIYRLQTKSEQQGSSCYTSNGVGFTKFDANILTEIAETLLFPKPITAEKYRILCRRMPKYAKQLTMVANGQLKV